MAAPSMTPGCAQLAEELRSLGLPLLLQHATKNTAGGSSSSSSSKKSRQAPLLLTITAADLEALRWETRQAVLLALITEVPGSPTGPALQQLVAKRRAARRAERQLERRGKPEELGLLPEYVRREEDTFRRRFMALVGEELGRQAGAPRALLAAVAANPERLLGDRALCLRAIEFFVARHRSHARTLAGLQQRVLHYNGENADDGSGHSPVAASTPSSASASSRRTPRHHPKAPTTTTAMPTPSPVVVEPAFNVSAARPGRRRSSSTSRKTPAPAAVAALSSPLLRQGMRRLSLQGGGGGALWPQEGAEEDEDGGGREEEKAAARESGRRRREGTSSSATKTPASKLLDVVGGGQAWEDGALEQHPLHSLHSEDKLQPKSRRSSVPKGRSELVMGLEELLPPVRKGKEKAKALAAAPAPAPARAAGVEEEVDDDDGGGDSELRAENARLRAELEEAKALYAAATHGGPQGVDARCLALLEQQNVHMAREAAALRRDLQGYRELSEGATALLGGVKAYVRELLAHAKEEEEEEEGEKDRERRGKRRQSSAPSGRAGGAAFWAAALAEAEQLYARWRSAKRTARVAHQSGLLLPKDAGVFLRRPAERGGAGGGGERPLSGEWEDRARLNGGGQQQDDDDEEEESSRLLNMEAVHALGQRLRGLAAALDEAARRELGALRDQARALQLQTAQLGLVLPLAATAAPVAVAKMTRERALLEAFDGLLVPRLRAPDLKARVEGLRRVVMAERGALAQGMATAVEEAVAWRKGRQQQQHQPRQVVEEEEEGEYAEDDGEEGGYIDDDDEVVVAAAAAAAAAAAGSNANGNGARRASEASGGRPQWV